MSYKKIKTAVITVGGKGTRLKSLTGNIPKPLYPIAGLSCLERSLINFKKNGIERVILLTSYKKTYFEEKKEYFSNKFGINLTIFEENKPLGECGGLWNIKNIIEEDFLFLGGDLVWDIDISRVNEFHKMNDAAITLLTHVTSHPHDSDLIVESHSKEVKKFLCKPHNNNDIASAFLGNAGISLINKKLLEQKTPNKAISLFKYLSELKTENSFKIFSYNTSEYIKDIGTPERFKKTEQLLRKNHIENLSYFKKQQALFLDRDGTLIDCPSKRYITNKEQIKYKFNVINYIKRIIKSYTLCIVVTNQPQIAMGMVNFDEVSQINGKIINDLYEFGLKIDLVSICPHHPHSGFIGEVNSLKINCFCRKPEPGLILAEALRRNIDLKKSLLIGDSINDEIASFKAGCDFLNVSEID